MEYNNCYYICSSNELYHHGIKGQKWGVRRFQKKDGTLTTAGRKRQAKLEYDAERKAAKAKYRDAKRDITGSDPERNKKIAKRVAAAAIMTATVATAAALYAKNPKAVNDLVAKVGRKTVESLKKGKTKAIELGKKYAKEAAAGAKEGFHEGLKEAPKKAVKAVMVGGTLMGTKRILDATVGKEEAARVFQANNSKKIGSFWKVNDPQDKEEDD